MRQPAKSAGKILDESLGRFSNVSAGELELARAQALTFLESNPSDGSPEETPRTVQPVRHSRWLAVATIAAAVTLAIFIPARALRSAPAILEEATGSRNVEYGEVVRGGTLRFPDGSRVQVHPESAVSLERADGGVRLSLHKGQVAVLAGEAVVQQGETSRTLRAGEQIQSPPVEPARRFAFDVVSIRPAGSGAVAGGRGGGVSVLPNGCAMVSSQVDPKRFAVSGVTVYTLIAYAYGANFINPLTGGCPDLMRLNVISGGSAWTRSELWDIDAVMPQSFNYSDRQLRNGDAPELKGMILALLEDRFRVVIRRERREVDAYALTLDGSSPRLTIPMERFPEGVDDTKFKTFWDKQRPGIVVKDFGGAWGKDVSVSDLVPMLSGETSRPVVDKTGFKGSFSFLLEYKSMNLPLGNGPTIFDGLRDQVGLKLEPAKTTVEVWVVESAEKPSEN
jgi:uncharacterized protein (TIGR03435 family)